MKAHPKSRTGEWNHGSGPVTQGQSRVSSTALHLKQTDLEVSDFVLCKRSLHTLPNLTRLTCITSQSVMQR